MTATTSQAVVVAADLLTAPKGTTGHVGASSSPARGRRLRFRFRKLAAGTVDVTTGSLRSRIAELEAQVAAAAGHLARIAELEAELAAAQRAGPDLSAMSDIDVAVLASEAAADILRLARAEAEKVTSAAHELLAEARGEVEEAHRRAVLVARQVRATAEAEIRERQAAAEAAASAAAERANEEAAQLCAQALAFAQQQRADADALGDRTAAEARATAERVVREAETRASDRVAEAEAEAARLIEQASTQRAAVIAEVDEQRRLAQLMLYGATTFQSAFVDSYDRLRSVVDESAVHLLEPVQRVAAKIAGLDRTLSERRSG